MSSKPARTTEYVLGYKVRSQNTSKKEIANKGRQRRRKESLRKRVECCGALPSVHEKVVAILISQQL